MNRGGPAARRLVRWVVPAVTLALLALFARDVDWHGAWSAIRRADPRLLAIATAVNLVTLVVKGVRWWLFLASSGVPGLWPAIRAAVAGAALNNVLVANGGDAARVALVARRRNVSTAPVLATLALDRLGDLASYAMMFAAAAATLPLPPELARWRGAAIVLVAAISVVCAVLLRRTRPPAGSDAPGPAVGRVRAYWRQVVDTSTAIVTGPRFAIAVALSFVAWLGQWATFHLAAYSVAFPMTASASLLALLAVNAGFLVRLTPGNVGVFQLLYALVAAAAGLDKDEAIAVAFLIQTIQYIPVTFIGLLLTPSLTGRDARVGSTPAAASDVARLDPR